MSDEGLPNGENKDQMMQEILAKLQAFSESINGSEDQIDPNAFNEIFEHYKSLERAMKMNGGELAAIIGESIDGVAITILKNSALGRILSVKLQDIEKLANQIMVVSAMGNKEKVLGLIQKTLRGISDSRDKLFGLAQVFSRLEKIVKAAKSFDEEDKNKEQ